MAPYGEGPRAIPCYSTDMAAVYWVIKILREKGYRFSVLSPDEGYTVRFSNDQTYGLATAAELPLAVCQAALKLPHPEVEPMAKAEIDVKVIKQTDSAVYVTDGDVRVWVPHSLIDRESDINSESDPGDEGTLIIPQWKAEDLELV